VQDNSSAGLSGGVSLLLFVLIAGILVLLLLLVLVLLRAIFAYAGKRRAQASALQRFWTIHPPHFPLFRADSSRAGLQPTSIDPHEKAACLPMGRVPQRLSVQLSTMQAMPASVSDELQLWPCKHINRAKAHFCRMCGEPAPPPSSMWKVEQEKRKDKLNFSPFT